MVLAEREISPEIKHSFIPKCPFGHQWEFQYEDTTLFKEKFTKAFKHMLVFTHDGIADGFEGALQGQLSIDWFQQAGLLEPLVIVFDGDPEAAERFVWPSGIAQAAKTPMQFIKEFGFENREERQPYTTPRNVEENKELVNKDINTMQLFLRELSQYPLFTPYQEQYLFTLLKEGVSYNDFIQHDKRFTALIDQDADNVVASHRPCQYAHLFRTSTTMEQVIANGNGKLVIPLAKKYIGRGLPFIDLISAGNIGLLSAIDKFDPTRRNEKKTDEEVGYKFSTYATWWVRQAISREVGDNGHTIRVPIHMNEKVGQAERIIKKLTSDHDHDPTSEEIETELAKQFKPEMAKKIMDTIKTFAITSLDRTIGEDNDTLMYEVLPDPDSAKETDEWELIESVKPLRNVIYESLTPRERIAYMMRKGLVDGQKHTLEEVGKEIGLTRERARQILVVADKKAKEAARKYLRKNHITGNYI